MTTSYGFKNELRAHARMDNPFDNQLYVYAFTNIAYDLAHHQRGDGRWFTPDKYDYLLVSCHTC